MDQQPQKPRLKPQTIDIDYMARTEGETALVVKVGTEDIQEIKLKIFEPPRFFEGFLVGRKFSEVGDIVSRICGICPISHMSTALQAVEDAMCIVPSEQTRKLRRLMCLSQVVASHIIHLYMLALPDYVGYPGFISMMPHFEKERDYFLKMKEAMNNVAEVIGGRPLHPISMVVNGFTKIPAQDSLLSLAKNIKEVLPLAAETVHLISRLPTPVIATQGEFVALGNDREYEYNEGYLASSRDMKLDIHDYTAAFFEKQEEYANTKKSFLKNGDTFMVGALARVNLKYGQFHRDTKDLALEVGFSLPDKNPFHNNLAQALEIYDGMIKCMQLLSDISPKQEKPMAEIRAGEGIGITEAPRGLLMHYYAINRRGVIEKANLVTPTSHNFANIEKDLHSLVLRYSHEDELGNLRLKCEQLVRAYDPCFSCSVH